METEGVVAVRPAASVAVTEIVRVPARCVTCSDNVHTRALAQFVASLRYEDIPGEVCARIKLLILDALGCAIYGAQLEWCRILQANRAWRGLLGLGDEELATHAFSDFVCPDDVGDR